jgi:hypothetical protein
VEYRLLTAPCGTRIARDPLAMAGGVNDGASPAQPSISMIVGALPALEPTPSDTCSNASLLLNAHKVPFLELSHKVTLDFFISN